MLKAFFDRLRAKRISPPSAETEPSLQTAFVEEIWSTWRYGTLAPLKPESAAQPKFRSETSPSSASKAQPKSANAAERVNQLKRWGKYEEALQVALSEIKREEESGPAVRERMMVPWYYWEAASIYRKLKRYEDEIALVRRFASNYDVHFRAYSKRYRSRPAVGDAWAARFLERVEAAKAAGARAHDMH